jgi:hypothetical protein
MSTDYIDVVGGQRQLSGRDLFPGTAAMFASERRMAVTNEWMRGWNACLDEIDRRGGFSVRHSESVCYVLPPGPLEMHPLAMGTSSANSVEEPIP